MEKYYVRYVDKHSSPREQEFGTKKAAESFIAEFMKENENNPDCWIEAVYWGRKLEVEPTYCLTVKVD